ncbi:penicillin-insensitive murein endopeptidase [Thaumasiovibrio subtropicus]|uniref:penicillin-insensitive murein endopeptidase n=1 Tax=Thaumasiovibrio subtropicus TaxID=1891207 RepID=UPI000B3505E6|nr:penicillin-insensitive murein endopeptidase [Thaumasiovibrio subtropicus]
MRAMALGLALLSSGAMASEWHHVTKPTSGEGSAIGSYANGCLSGGQPLPLDGEGYQVIRTSRERYYGHPNMITFLQDLGKRVNRAGIDDLLIGDISMPRGGNFVSGHQSHQTGLDADIWMLMADRKMSLQERESLSALNMVDLKNYRIQFKNWTEDHANIVRFAAEDVRVSRIFVHPVIKETLCRGTWEDRSWLRKIRPWYGHTSHMHVRLTCPQGDAYCKNQAAPPPGDGCGKELYSWRPKAPPKEQGQQQSGVKELRGNQKPARVVKIKPQQCEAVLTGS